MEILFIIISIIISILIFKANNVLKIALLFFVLTFLPSNIIITYKPIQLSAMRIAIYSLIISTIIYKKNFFHNIPKELKYGLSGILFSLLLIGILDTRLDLLQKLYRPFYVFTENFLLLVIIYLNINRYEDVITLHKILFVYYFIVTIYGLLNYFLLSNPYYEVITNLFGGVNYFNSYLYSIDRHFRINSFIQHPITYGYFCSLIIIIIIQYMMINKTNPKLIILTILLLTNLLLTNSRTPVIILLLSLILYVMFISKNKIKIGIISILILFIAFQINKSILIDSINIFSAKESLGGSSLNLREIQLFSSYLLFKNKPLQGNGINYIFEGLGYRTEEYEKSDKNLMGFESYIFKLLIEQGLLGIIGNIIFFGSIFYYLKRKRKILNKTIIQYSNLGIIILISFLLFMVGTGELYSFQFSISLIAIQIRAINLIENKLDNNYK